MDYEEREEEFYQKIEKAKGKIEGLDVSEEERIKLYDFVHETIQRYESNMENLQKGIIATEELAKRRGELSKAIQDLSNKSKGVLNKLEGAVGVLEQKTGNKPLN